MASFTTRTCQDGSQGYWVYHKSGLDEDLAGIEEAMGFPGHAIPPSPPQVKCELEEDGLANGSEGVTELKAGVLVIGSGSGASAFINSLLRNLHPKPHFSADRTCDILIIEKGYTTRPQPEDEAITQLWEGGGICSSDEGVSILAGSTWGGGSAINWSACLQTDRKVREEWTRGIMDDLGKDTDPHGKMFLGGEWQDCMEQYVSDPSTLILVKCRKGPGCTVAESGGS
jgi:hypothetical protein